MRIRSLGEFPFLWVDAGTTGDLTEYPVALTRRQAVRLWWGPKKLSFSASITMSDDDGAPSEGSNTLNVSATLKRRRFSSGHPMSEADADTEIDLVYPGNDGADDSSFYSGCYEYVVDGVVTASATGALPDPGSYVDTGNILLSVETFGTVEHCVELVGEPSVFYPHFAIYLAVPIFPNATVYLVTDASHTDYGTPLGFDGDISGIDASFAGETIRCKAFANPWDTSWPYEVCTAATMTLSTSEFFEYDTQAGGEPVWNSATGAQILDPREASVP